MALVTHLLVRNMSTSSTGYGCIYLSFLRTTTASPEPDATCNDLTHKWWHDDREISLFTVIASA